MKILKAIFLAAFLFTAFAFKSPSDPEVAGIYGISKSYQATLNLQINADNTFSYTDLSDPKSKVQTHGNWELKNNTIILKNYTSELPIPTKLRVEKDRRAVRYRKGLGFYRLARI